MLHALKYDNKITLMAKLIKIIKIYCINTFLKRLTKLNELISNLYDSNL